jgi:hypothetical protein
MKPGSPQARALYVRKEQEFKTELQKNKDFIKEMESQITGTGEKRGRYDGYRAIAIANEYLNMVSLYIRVTEDMEYLRGVKNETYISEGRKTYYSALFSLEKVFTDIINLEPTEIQKNLESVPKFDPARKIIFFRKMGFILDRLQGAFGEKSKYKWSFVDMFARYAVLMKNAMDYRQLSIRDPRKPFFEENEVLVNMLVEVLNKAADRLREKYEMVTQEWDDMNRAIRILDELRRFHTLMGDSKAAEEAKKKMDAWNDKLEKDMKAKESKKKLKKK